MMRILLLLGVVSTLGCDPSLRRDSGPDLHTGAPVVDGGQNIDSARRADTIATSDLAQADLRHADLRAPDAKINVCAPIAGAKYSTLSTVDPSKKPAKVHGDVNLLLRSVRLAGAAKNGLVQINGPTDHAPPPQLFSLFKDDRVPTFVAGYQVGSWDWGCDCQKGYIGSPEVTLSGVQTAPGEQIRTPHSGYDIGGGHTALVLYAAKDTITLKYTREDNVVKGYTIHLSGICVEPSLQALYEQSVKGGRVVLPALSSRQALGRAAGNELRVSIRDTGSWMDPRSKKDWWQGK